MNVKTIYSFNGVSFQNIEKKNQKLWLQVVWPEIAIVFTFALFLLMAYLVTPEGEVSIEPEKDILIEIMRKERSETSQKKARPRAKKPKLKEMPPPRLLPKTKPEVTSNMDDIGGHIPRFEDNGFSFKSSVDRRATPIVTIPPQYPQKALLQ